MALNRIVRNITNENIPVTAHFLKRTISRKTCKKFATQKSHNQKNCSSEKNI